MSAISVIAQELSFIDTYSYCVVAPCVLLFYDWILCLEQEVSLIWTWRSRGVTLASLVYAVSRYTWLLQIVLSVATINPMSDLSCKANIWTQVAMETLALISFSTFSAIRAYALSNRSKWIAAIVILLALPPVAMRIVGWVYQVPLNQPTPWNCGASSFLPGILWIPVTIFIRVPQLVSELLVVSITWWYTYESYRIRKGVKLGKTISALLFYNGSMYFLFLATLYMVDIVLSMAPIPLAAQDAATFLEAFIDSVTSILVCRFMLSLRRFDTNVAVAASSGCGPQYEEYMESMMFKFSAQPSHSLPALISSFAHPVHVEDFQFKINADTIEDVCYEY